jgi:hypothetical protein
MEDRTLLTTYTVHNLQDNGAGSLRQAVLDANAHAGVDIIAFADGLEGTIHLTSGKLLITDSVTIQGPGADMVSVSGNDASRVFETAAGINVTISGLTITHGKAPDQGGGILNDGISAASGSCSCISRRARTRSARPGSSPHAWSMNRARAWGSAMRRAAWNRASSSSGLADMAGNSCTGMHGVSEPPSPPARLPRRGEGRMAIDLTLQGGIGAGNTQLVFTFF